ncbi:MAG: BrxA/BrxB family bacilliredoxin [Chitinophagales bacterium]
MYPPQLTAPMKADLTDFGFEDITTADQVDDLITKSEGTVFLVVNSVCGCAAGNARPAAKAAVHYSEKKPDRIATVFAGVDFEAVNRAREYTLPYPPSSPSMAIFKDGKLVHFVERLQIEGNSAQQIAQHLLGAFAEHCELVNS